MPLGIMSVGLMTHIVILIMKLSIMTLGIMKLSIMTLGIMKLSIMTLGIPSYNIWHNRKQIMTLSNITQANCHLKHILLSIVVLTVTMLCVIRVIVVAQEHSA